MSVATDVPVRLAWKLNFTKAEAMDWVKRKLPRATKTRVSLHYHPMLACEFHWDIGKTRTRINVLVDLVSGRAFASAPWFDNDFENLPEEDSNQEWSGQTPAKISLDQARQNAREVALVLISRKRRLGNPGTLELGDREILCAKPNWWVTGTHRGNKLELLLDGRTGRHYIFSG